MSQHIEQVTEHIRQLGDWQCNIELKIENISGTVGPTMTALTTVLHTLHERNEGRSRLRTEEAKQMMPDKWDSDQAKGYLLRFRNQFRNYCVAFDYRGAEFLDKAAQHK